MDGSIGSHIRHDVKRDWLRSPVAGTVFDDGVNGVERFELLGHTVG